VKASVALFVLEHGAAAPEPAAPFEVEGERDDDLRAAAIEAIRARGLRVRAVSFGPRGLTAYAEREA
jgi:uncharacterized LabA/DUF88 family protein